MKKVLVFGTFDGLHKGHLDFFCQAKEQGDFLIAVVARDSSAEQNKNKKPKYGEQERLKAVQECDFVNEAILGTENHNLFNDPYDIIKEINPDVVCLGYDQAQFLDKLKAELKRMNVPAQIKALKPYKPEIYRSSFLNKQF